MKLSEYTAGRAEALYRMALPETDPPLAIKLLWFDNLCSDDIIARINLSTHRHSFYEIHFILSGSACYELCGQTVTVPESSALLITPETFHRYISCTGEMYKATVAFSDTAEHGKLFGDIPFAVFEFPESVIKNIDYMLKSSDHTDIFTPHIICGRIYEIIGTAFDALGIRLPEAEKADTDPRVTAAIKFIEKNCCKSISCEEVAGECCLSSKQLGRIFKNSTGISLYDYITNARIKQAKKLLSDSKVSVKEIAFEIGFSEQSSFTSFFKRHCGISPGDFRKNRQ